MDLERENHHSSLIETKTNRIMIGLSNSINNKINRDSYRDQVCYLMLLTLMHNLSISLQSFRMTRDTRKNINSGLKILQLIRILELKILDLLIAANQLIRVIEHSNNRLE